jgi:two-component system response regulator
MTMDLPRNVDILLVEDNADHAEFTLKALGGSKTVRTHWVKDGQEALDFLNDRPRPSVIFLDIHLPKIDGNEVLRRIKADTELRSIPVVMLTTSDREEEMTAAYHAGANSYVTKPVALGQFAERVGTLKDYWARTSQLPAA